MYSRQQCHSQFLDSLLVRWLALVVLRSPCAVLLSLDAWSTLRQFRYLFVSVPMLSLRFLSAFSKSPILPVSSANFASKSVRRALNDTSMSTFSRPHLRGSFRFVADPFRAHPFAHLLHRAIAGWSSAVHLLSPIGLEGHCSRCAGLQSIFLKK